MAVNESNSAICGSYQQRTTCELLINPVDLNGRIHISIGLSKNHIEIERRRR